MQRVRQNMRAAFLTFALLFVVSGCAWFDKKANPVLQGERKEVLPPAENSAENADAAPRLDEPRTVTAWPQHNGNASQSGVHADFVPKLKPVWEVSIGSGERDRMVTTARPVAGNGKIFAMDVHGRVTALDALSGKQLWRVSSRKNRGKALSGGLAMGENAIYVSNGLTQVLAISPENGALIWQAEMDAPVRAAPVYRDGKVYVVTRSDQTFALDAATGKNLWQHKGLLEITGILGGAAPAVDEDMVVVSYASGETVALSPGNGSVLWNNNLSVGRPQNNLATLHDFRAPPLLLRDSVIAANFSSNIGRIDRRLGDMAWNQSFGASQPMTVSGDTVFMISTNAQLMALSQKDGTKFWSKSLPPPVKPDEDVDAKQQYWYGPLLMNDKLLVISADGTAQLRDASTGDIVREVKDLPPPAENPIVLNQMVYWVTVRGDLVGFQ